MSSAAFSVRSMIPAALQAGERGAPAARNLLYAYLAIWAVVGLATLWFFPVYAYPYGDEATYFSYALHPWTLISDFFEGFRPKEVPNPYAPRLFVLPFSVVFWIFGFTYSGARVVLLIYALLTLYLTYRIVEVLADHRQALLTVVLLSFAPAFFFFSHGARPEGMMNLFALLCLWLAIREPQITPRTFAWIGFLSASTLWIHTHGVLLPGILLLCLVIYDQQRSWVKVRSFLAGGAVFGVIFFLLNILPALDTLREFGLLPVSYESGNTIPILHSLNLKNILWRSYNIYINDIENSWLDGWAFPFTVFIGCLSVVGLIQRSPERRWVALKAFLAIMLFALLFVFPNRRLEYTFYLYPVGFILAINALRLARIPRVRVVGIVAILCVIFAALNISGLRIHWVQYLANQQVESALRSEIAKRGDPATVRVMGSPQFHAMVPDTQFRSFHSLNETRSLKKTIERLRPDIVILDQRAAATILRIFNENGGDSRKKWKYLEKRLVQLGFRGKGIVVRGAHLVSIMVAPARKEGQAGNPLPRSGK